MFSTVNKKIDMSINHYNNRYLIFAYDYYDSSGGLNDCVGSFNFKEDLIRILEENERYHCYQVLDSQTGSIILYMKDFSGISELSEVICKSLCKLALDGKDMELNNIIKTYTNFFSDDEIKPIINNLESFSVNLKNTGFLECYLNIEVLICMLKENKLYEFMQYLPITIKSIESSNISDVVLNYLKSLY